MDPGALCVSVMVACLLGAARCSADDNCPCPDIPPLTNTQPPPRQCFPIGHRFRYTCVEGKVRKAGTSSLITCQNDSKVYWKPANLECIDDPKRPQPPQGTLTTAHTPSPHDIMTTSIISTISASTSLQMTPSKRFSPSEVTQSNSAEPTTASQRDVADRSQEAVTTARTTTPTDRTTAASATAHTFNTTAHARLYGKEAAAGISCVSLVIICASIGLSLYFLRRRKRQNVSHEQPEEQVAMNSTKGLPE